MRKNNDGDEHDTMMINNDGNGYNTTVTNNNSDIIMINDEDEDEDDKDDKDDEDDKDNKDCITLPVRLITDILKNPYNEFNCYIDIACRVGLGFYLL